MPSHRSFLAGTLGAATAAAAIALAGAAGGAQASPKLTQCQHGRRSLGFAAYDLKRVSGASACKVVRALVQYQSNPANPPLYKCGGPPKYTPTLLLGTFEGWSLKLTPEFQMSKHGASFDVTGTDFIACDN